MRINLGNFGGYLKGLFDGVPRTDTSNPIAGSATLINSTGAIEHMIGRIDSTVATSNVAAWKTGIHDEIIDKAFPGLSNKDRSILKYQSAVVDLDTLSEARANEHAMRRPGQTVEQAKAGWQKFIDGNNEEARRIQAMYAKGGGTGISELALQYFGRGNHAVMDETSPTHKGFQLYQQPKFTGSPVMDAMTAHRFKKEMDVHTAGEAKINQEQMKEAVAKVRANFGSVFGEDMLQYAIGRGGSW